MPNHLGIEIFCPIGMLYNILLPINHYIDSIAINAAILQLPLVISSDL